MSNGQPKTIPDSALSPEEQKELAAFRELTGNTDPLSLKGTLGFNDGGGAVGNLWSDLGDGLQGLMDAPQAALDDLDQFLFGDYPERTGPPRGPHGPGRDELAKAEQNLRIQGYKEGADGPFMGPWGSGQFKSGHGSSTAVNPEWQEPGFYLSEDNVRGRFDDLLALYDQLHSSDSEAAKSYFDTIQAYIGDSGTRGANQIQSDTDVINRQLDDMWENSFGVDGREAKNDLRFEAEFQNAIQGMEDTQEAADARLGTWGIDPQRWTAGAGAETAALLTSQAMNGARFANEMCAIMKMAHGMANARVNQGMAAEARNLANTVSQLGLQAQLQYKSNIQQIDRELLMNKIGVEQASMALNAAEEAALDKSLAAMQAYQILGAMTNTSSKQWMAADQVGITDDLFARTPLIPSLPDTDRPLGATAIHPEGFEYPFPVSYKDIGELNQIIETYLQMDRNA